MTIQQAIAAVDRYQKSGAAHRADTTLLTAATVLVTALRSSVAQPSALPPSAEQEKKS